MKIHLYVSCFRVEALIASQLDPEEFGAYMAVGTEKLSSGQVMFLEIAPDFQNSYLNMEGLADRCVPHPAGTPKRSLYLSIYRVLEHVDADAVGALYLVTRDGRVLRIDPQEYETEEPASQKYLYQEICPVTPLIASLLPPPELCRFITNPANAIFVPRILFADMQIGSDETGRLASYLPYRRPEHIMACLKELDRSPDKKTKTVDRDHSMEFFYRTIGRGFFLGDQTGMRFYPFPGLRELQGKYYRWWRSASTGL